MARQSKTGKTPLLQLPLLNVDSVKIAELSLRITFKTARAFPASRWHELPSFGPNVLAGSTSELLRLIERIDLRTIEIPSVDHAIFVLTEVGDKPMTDAMRVTLWQRFGVPVYEVYLGPNRELLACECEAQEGWHVEPGVQFFLQGGQLALETSAALFPTGIASKLETSPCPCGRPGLRILYPDAVSDSEVSLLAASA